MDESGDSTNKSIYTTTNAYYENPSSELQNFISISNRNFEAIEDNIEQLKNDVSNVCVWENFISKNKSCLILSKEIEKLTIDTTFTDGEIQHCKRKLDAKRNDIESMEQLIQEYVITLKELEDERKEVTLKIINKHKALKQAIRYYKQRLNIYFSIDKKGEIYNIQICLFTQKLNDKYSFIISKKGEDKWNLVSTNPKLDTNKFLQIQKRFLEENSLSALLFVMRKIFLHYIKQKKL